MEAITSFRDEYRFLSNFYPSPIEFLDKVYPTVEHAYQAAKTIDEGEREAIRLAPTPGEAKKMGRSITLRKDWDMKKVIFMRIFVAEKFFDPILEQKLLATGDAELIEGNTWGDTFWGVCDGVGENNLGKILMKVRKLIRAEKEFENGH